MAPLSAAKPAEHRSSLLDRFLMQGGIVITFLIVAVVATALVEPRFLNRLNLINVMRNFALLLIPSLAQMLVMTAGGFDLSVGAVVAISSVVTAAVMLVGSGYFPDMEIAIILLSLVAAIGVGALVGLTNAGLVASLSLSPFMVTLAMMSVLMGIALYFTQGIPIYGVAQSFITGVGRGQFLGLPIVLHVALVVLIGCIVMQRFTALGRHIYAVGSDLRSARLSGVATGRTLAIAYVLAGMLAALTGFLMTSRLGSGQSTIGGTLALETIAAAVIGGVSLRGGVGRAEHVALAALFLAVIANAMNLVQVDSKYQTLVLGAVLIVALAIDRLLLRKRQA
ncbi:ABC transporter permease [Mesorhizobium helmanticense]|uniref:ABC transporter permease n=1 Tax=Mesorhizobium helmanticense TaxID=1776423 RepID=A0A2T4ISV0_9HYPH|nr:ABC transporter permease [Mesorhizobium helmanticense]PTE08653.1 ABC transporter permease [Mesorhizobium helmanticense]